MFLMAWDEMLGAFFVPNAEKPFESAFMKGESHHKVEEVISREKIIIKLPPRLKGALMFDIRGYADDRLVVASRFNLRKEVIVSKV